MGNDPSDGVSETVSRREYITATGAGTAVGFAGCLQTSSHTDDGNAEENETAGGEDGSVDAEQTDEDESTDDETDRTEDLSGHVSITGSSTVFPISDTMAQRFIDEHPDVDLTVDVTGTSSGFEHYLCTGDADINTASRPIASEELATCAENDSTPVEMEIAGDAIAVVVNGENDWVDCLSTGQLAQIWRADGTDTWADIDADWPDEEIERYAPERTSGTVDWFSETVIEDGSHRDDYQATADGGIVVRGVENSRYAIGYVGYAYYATNEDRVDAISISTDDGGECREPSLKGASDGSYPLVRPLYLYPAEEALEREEVREFVRFYVENATADWIADDLGYVPSSEEQSAANREALEEAVGE